MPKAFIEEKLSFYSNKHFSDYPEVCYINLNNKNLILDLLNKNEIEPRYMDICIHIKWDDKVILGYDMHDLNLWEDIISALENLLVQSDSVVHFGIGTILLKMTNASSLLKWEITDEFPPCNVYYSHIGKTNEIIEGLIKGAENYYSTLIEYNFPLKEEFEERLRDLISLKNKMDLII